MDDADAIQKQMSGRDKQKLDQYLTSVREIEQRIERAERMPVNNPSADAPAGIPASSSSSVFPGPAKVMPMPARPARFR